MAPATFLISTSPAQLDALVTKYLGAGKTFADAGTLPETQGVVLGYSIDRVSAATAVVTFTVIKKPWIASVGMIENALKQQMGLA